MIHDFNDEALLRLWRTGSAPRFSFQLSMRLLAFLDVMDAVRTFDDLKLIPGCRIVPLFPEGEDTMVMPISASWQIVFRREFDVFSGLHVKYLLPETRAIETAAGEYDRPTMRKPTPPGSILEEFFIKPMGLKQSELADHIGIARPHLSGIVKKNDRPITADVALRLQAALKVPADFWLTLYSRYAAWREISNRPNDYLDIAPLTARVPTRLVYVDEHDIPSAADIDSNFGPPVANSPV